MANINDYFEKTDSQNSHSTLKLRNGRYFNEKIKDFYTECIEGELKRIESYIAKWDEFLFNYVNLDLPIYWIRKYESSGDKFNKKNNNRRSCLTLVVDNNTNTVKFAYAFVSNYDAQELYNMIRNGVDAPNEKDFLEMLQKGEYQFHYQEDGKDCQDNLVSYFEKRGNIKGGVLNLQNWYLAHINGVNDIPYENEYHLSNAQINELFFPKGLVSDWKQVSLLNNFTNFKFNRNKTNTNLDRRVRIIDINDIYENFRKLEPNATNAEIDELYKKLLKAHFLRFVHPINYFLVPSKKCEVNNIFGRKNVSIGEYGHLIEYIKNKRKNIFDNSLIKKAEESMLLQSNNDSKKSYGDEKIYISYGNAYIDYSFLNDEQKVQVPAGYNTLEDFIGVNSGNGNQYNLIIYYSVSNKEYHIAYSPKKQISQLGIKSKIIDDIKKTLAETLICVY